MLDPALKILARFTARREGLVLVPYRDGEGWSIGGGHYLGKHDTPPDLVWTVQDCFKALPDDLIERLKTVDKYIHVPLKDNQRHALLDLYYQGGTDGLEAVAKIINARIPSDPNSVLFSDREAAREFLNWDTSANGTHMSGLLSRRARNVAIFAAAEYGSDLDRIPLWRTVDTATHRPTMSQMEWYDVAPDDLPTHAES